MISETGAKGRLADTTLGVAVAKDIVMVVLLALALALTKTFSPDGHGFEVEILTDLALELGLSLVAGVILGFVIIGYIRYLGAELWLFVVGVIFAMTAIAHEFHLEALLVFIVAGFVVQNASQLGHDFVHLVERVALPVYVVFFSVAGAGLDLRALRSVLGIALALVAVRLLAIYVGTGIATKIADEPEPVRRNAWLSFVSQAGVVIGLSIIVENSLPGLGPEIRTLVMGTVAIHLLLGPVLFKLALTRAGEIEGVGDGVAQPSAADTASRDAPLPPHLAEPVEALEERLYATLAGLRDAAVVGPVRLAQSLGDWPDGDREASEAAVEEYSTRELSIALNRFWSEALRAALEAPRQLSVDLEDHWYAPEDGDSGGITWAKRVRRVRRRFRRLTGSEAVLRRVAPVRDLALYHLNGALSEDLEPAVTAISAQPALAHAFGIPAERGVEEEDGEGIERLGPQEAAELLTGTLDTRFAILRSELARAGTLELPSGRRRPSVLHERATKARARIFEVSEAWVDYAHAIIGFKRRAEASNGFLESLSGDSEQFVRDLESRFDTVVVRPIQRAKVVVRQALESVAALDTASSASVENRLIEIGESVSQGLRRHTLAGLRRALDVRAVERDLAAFDHTVDALLEALPEAVRVIDPASLPRAGEPLRSYPDPADHQFRLIASGAVERTLRPAFAEARNRVRSALEEAERSVNELRESLERRFDAAIDAVIEEAREGGEAPTHELRRSLEIAEAALESAAASLTELEAELADVGLGTVATISADLSALIERLEGQLAIAKPLEARLQAERARVELRGTAVLRLLTSRARDRLRALLQRIGLRSEHDEEDDETPLRPAGRAGSDRAVLFGILFDETTLAGKIFDGALIITILASIVVLMLESVEPFRMEYGATLLALEWLFTLLFTAEYAARLYVIERPAQYAFSFFGLIDLLAVVPTYLSLLVPGGRYLMVIRVIRVARAFRVLKLARYVGEARVLTDALRASRYKITVFMVYVLSVAVVVGSAMYLIEGAEAGFTSIPRGVYWAIVTLTTVGFGDITPQSPLGQALAALLMVLGYGIIAVPTGIVTAQIAGSSRRTQPTATCAKCGHEEHEASTSFCQVCGHKLSL